MSERRGKMMALFSAACYGVAMPLARMAYDHGTNALTIMTLRYLSLALILAAWLLVGGHSLKVPPRILVVCLVIGVTFVGTAGGALAAIVYMPVSLAVLVFYTYPTLTLVAECVVERRAPHRLEIATVLLALVGLGLTLQASLGAFDLIGVELALLASVSAAIALILTSRTLKKIGARLIGFYACAVASSISAAIAGVSGAPAHNTAFRSGVTFLSARTRWTTPFWRVSLPTKRRNGRSPAIPYFDRTGAGSSW